MLLSLGFLKFLFMYLFLTLVLESCLTLYVSLYYIMYIDQDSAGKKALLVLRISYLQHDRKN